jgi:hypothetical protein
MGGLIKCRHWIDELRAPLTITQPDISKDLNRFSHMFPVNLIPFMTNSEKKVDYFRKKIIKLQVEQLNM